MLDFEQQRRANCFTFDHQMKFDCNGQSECEHEGQCFQDNADCPQRSFCICTTCFYGRRCQFSTNGFSLSLDAILGYHILPDVHLKKQPTIVQTSLGLTMVFILAGLTNSILCMITFKNKSARQVGCGLYLFVSSIAALVTMIMFGFKFWILILTQMGAISNRSFLSFQCRSLDFLLRIGISIDQWLSACVAIERAVTAIQGIRFNKNKSKRAAKVIILLLLVFAVCVCIIEPFYRRLIVEESTEDDAENRIWCIVSYPRSLQVWNSIVQSVNVLVPFLTNIISGTVLIIMKSRRKSHVNARRNYIEILRREFRQHRHLFISSIILFIITLPRIILTFVSKCMKSTDDSWLFLAGYYISFIPPMSIFVTFISPSKFYKTQFLASVVKYRTTVQRAFRRMS